MADFEELRLRVVVSDEASGQLVNIRRLIDTLGAGASAAGFDRLKQQTRDMTMLMRPLAQGQLGVRQGFMLMSRQYAETGAIVAATGYAFLNQMSRLKAFSDELTAIAAQARGLGLAPEQFDNARKQLERMGLSGQQATGFIAGFTRSVADLGREGSRLEVQLMQSTTDPDAMRRWITRITGFANQGDIEEAINEFVDGVNTAFENELQRTGSRVMAADLAAHLMKGFNVDEASFAKISDRLTALSDEERTQFQRRLAAAEQYNKQYQQLYRGLQTFWQSAAVEVMSQMTGIMEGITVSQGGSERMGKAAGDAIGGVVNDMSGLGDELNILITSFQQLSELSMSDVMKYVSDAAKEHFNAWLEQTWLGRGLNWLRGTGQDQPPIPRQAGGPVIGGQPYLVGEQGRELFVPAGAGRILPSTAPQVTGLRWGETSEQSFARRDNTGAWTDQRPQSRSLIDEVRRLNLYRRGPTVPPVTVGPPAGAGAAEYGGGGGAGGGGGVGVGGGAGYAGAPGAAGYSGAESTYSGGPGGGPDAAGGGPGFAGRQPSLQRQAEETFGMSSFGARPSGVLDEHNQGLFGAGPSGVLGIKAPQGLGGTAGGAGSSGMYEPPVAPREAAPRVAPGEAVADVAGRAGGRVREQQARVAGIRKLPISTELKSQLEYAGLQTGLEAEIFSGGQAKKGTQGPRTGSTRHDLGGAADLKLRDPKTGRLLDSRIAEDRKRMQDYIAATARAGATGIGADYMGSGAHRYQALHIGGGPVSTWGGGKGWTAQALSRGRASPLSREQRAELMKGVVSGTATSVAEQEQVRGAAEVDATSAPAQQAPVQSSAAAAAPSDWGGGLSRSDKRIPAAIRYANPGAQYPSKRATELYGSTDTGIIGGGHKIAGFPTPVHGMAANIDNLEQKYVGMTMSSAIKKWSGGGRSKVPGWSDNTIITKEHLKDPKFIQPFFSEMQKAEAGKEWMTKEQMRAAHGMYLAGGSKQYEAQRNVGAQAVAQGGAEGQQQGQTPGQAEGTQPQEMREARLGIDDTRPGAYRDISETQRLPVGGKMDKPQGLLIHHTAGFEKNAERVGDVLRNRKLSVQYVIDRDGDIVQMTPEGRTAFHAGKLEKSQKVTGRQLGNTSLEGVEVIARGEKDVTPQQRSAIARLVRDRSERWGYDPKTSVWGHGELTGRKEREEGATARLIREGKLKLPEKEDKTLAQKADRDEDPTEKADRDEVDRSAGAEAKKGTTDVKSVATFKVKVKAPAGTKVTAEADKTFKKTEVERETKPEKKPETKAEQKPEKKEDVKAEATKEVKEEKAETKEAA
jgi:N-acetyl-anhydromuramyl-L-alanine amidase AmpD